MDLGRLEHMPTVKVAMTPFPWSIDVDAPLSQAGAMMSEHEIHHLPVTERGALVGVISGREVALVTALAPTRDASHAPLVRDAIVLHAYAVEDTEPLDVVLASMASQRIASALVTRRGKLVGVFTVTDACQLTAEWLRACFPESRGDDVA